MLMKVLFLIVAAALVVVLMMIYGALMLLIELLTSEKPPQIEKSQLKKPARRSTRLTDRSKKWLEIKGNQRKEEG